MDQICDPTYCTGCQVCMDSCAHGAIAMIADSEGFLRPTIDQTKCVDCGLCSKTCPVNNVPTRNYPLEAYSGWISDEAIRLQSSSGGAFSALAIPILERGGTVLGAQLDNDLNVTHTAINSVDDLHKLRGSKYVQSKTAGCFKQVRDLLRAGKEVLFSGTPCQIAALNNFLRRDYENLITVDLVCHGIPSPLIFAEWKRWFMSKNRLSEIESIRFRGKEKSWIFYNSEITGKKPDGSKFRYIGKYNKDAWARGFLSDKFLRPSCHKCYFAGIERVSDFTIADWWGYTGTNNEPNDYEQKGVSLILCNTPKAKTYFKDNADKIMHVRRRDIADAQKTSGPLTKAFPAPKDRDVFWNDFRTLTFDEVVKKHMQPKRLNLRELIILNIKPSASRNKILNIYYKIRKVKRMLTK